MLHAWPAPAANLEINCVNWQKTIVLYWHSPWMPSSHWDTNLRECWYFFEAPKTNSHTPGFAWLGDRLFKVFASHALLVKCGKESSGRRMDSLSASLYLSKHVCPCRPQQLRSGIMMVLWHDRRNSNLPKKNAIRSVYMVYIANFLTCSVMFASDLASILGTVPESSTRKVITQQTQ